MNKYWSCSKFADWIRSADKSNNRILTEKSKNFRYWIADKFLDVLQTILIWPVKFYRTVTRYIQIRFFIKTHGLTSTLKPGEWHDLDKRVLYSLFDELVNFVEIEKAIMQLSSGRSGGKYKLPWHYKYLGMSMWRSKEAGIECLKWETTLKYDENLVKIDDEKFEKPTPQSLAADEILKLYEWWTIERPLRKSPERESGYEEYYEGQEKLRNEQGVSSSDWLVRDRNEDESLSPILEELVTLEEAQENEDTEMLIRLIKIRNYLWT